MGKKLIYVMVLFIIYSQAYSLPQFSMLTGHKCMNCHISSEGGAVRNGLGWYTRSDVGLISPDDIGLGKFFENAACTNEFFNKKVIFGFDFRYETAFIFSERKYFGMQASPYLVVKPFDWLTAEGSYNLFYNFNIAPWPGQKKWSAFVILQPDLTLPSLKAGFFEPPIGIHYDDHTLLVSQEIEGSPGSSFPNQMLPPDYAEYGAEINYEGLKWLSLTAGLFNSNSMADIYAGGTSNLVDTNTVSAVFRAALWKHFFEDKLNLNLGASYFVNHDFKITAVFLNAGLTDNISLMTEVLWSDKTGVRKTRNYVIDATYQLLDALLLDVRYEGAETDFYNNQNLKFNQYVFGLQIFPFPFIEFRPEYRVFRPKSGFYPDQLTAQLHLFY
jgi:hypothetical protein